MHSPLVVDNEAHILHFYEGHPARVLVYYHHLLRVKSKTHKRPKGGGGRTQLRRWRRSPPWAVAVGLWLGQCRLARLALDFLKLNLKGCEEQNTNKYFYFFSRFSMITVFLFFLFQADFSICH
jgi:hypothetical protein